MERPAPQLNAASEQAPTVGPDATPFSQQRVVLTKQAYIELKWKANYWQAPHSTHFSGWEVPAHIYSRLR